MIPESECKVTGQLFSQPYIKSVRTMKEADKHFKVVWKEKKPATIMGPKVKFLNRVGRFVNKMLFKTSSLLDN